MAIYCRHPYIHLRARSYLSLRSGGSILLSKAGPFLASGEEGVDLVTVASLLGHKKIQMTMRYAHLAPEHRFLAVEKLNRYTSSNS